VSYSSERILLSSQRESRVSRYRFWVMLVIPLAALLFQIYVPLFFRFLSFLDLPLLVVIYLAVMRRNPVSGLLMGALVGLAQDSLSKNPLGMYGIVNTLVGYFAASIGMKLDVDNLTMRLFLAYVFFLMHQCLYWIMERALLRHSPPFDWQHWLVLGLLNALVGAALFHFLDKLRITA
jgi:rod shape-determining protein MreD